jgi:hypothetical protein
MPRENRWTFIPPPACTFQLHKDGVILQFQKGLELAVERYMRGWIAVYESAARHKALPGMNGEKWPQWENVQSQAVGVTSWLFTLPPSVRVHTAMLTNQSGGIVIGASRGGVPGSITLYFPAGQEVEVGEALHDALDKNSGRRRNLRGPGVTLTATTRTTAPSTARAIRHLPAGQRPGVAPAGAPLIAQAVRADSMARAARIGDEFFARLAAEHGLESTPAASHTADTEEPPPPSANAYESDAPPSLESEAILAPQTAPAAPPAFNIPKCTCPDTQRSTGAHTGGCPAEDYPMSMC